MENKLEKMQSELNIEAKPPRKRHWCSDNLAIIKLKFLIMMRENDDEYENLWFSIEAFAWYHIKLNIHKMM